MISDKLYRLIPSRLLAPAFLALGLSASLTQRHLSTLKTGLAESQTNISQTIVRALLFSLPSLPEQHRIVEILDTLDKAIRKTEQIITKLKQVKQGLLQDLLTRGIDDNGEPRNPDLHPEQFKHSPLGRVPAAWRVVGLEQLAENHDGKRVPLKQSDRDHRRGTYPYYGASGIIDWIDGYLFDGEFVLLGEDGENVVSRHLPLAFIVRGRFWTNNHAHVYSPRAGVDIRFLADLLEATDYSRLTSGSAQPKLTQSALGRLRFAAPPDTEQKCISNILSAHKAKISLETAYLEKLRLLKQGLMEDLLTGRVRVTSFLDEAAP